MGPSVRAVSLSGGLYAGGCLPFSINSRDLRHARAAAITHSGCMSCIQSDLSEILREAGFPDPEMTHLIERALRDGQIDAQKAELAYLNLRLRHRE